MAHRIVLWIVCPFVLCGVASGQTTKKESTIFGEVIDVKSYIAYGMKADNADRKEASLASMNAGNPLGILEKGTGKVYLVAMAQQTENANVRLKDFLGLRVYIKGLVYKRGSTQLILLNDIGKTIR
jgi:hypothetical protein